MAVAELTRGSRTGAKPRQTSKRAGKPSRAYHTPRRSDLDNSDTDLDLSTLGGRMAYARLRAGMTQHDLGNAIDKVRGTIVAYETNKINPPVSIVEAIAKELNMSPSFIAFGEQGVKMSKHGNAAEETVTLDEITYGRDGSYVSGAFAMPRAMAESYAAETKYLKVVVMDHHAPQFNLRSGDRVFIDTSVTDMTNQHDTYLIAASGGMEIVRPEGGLIKGSVPKLFGPRGEKLTVKAADLKVLGAVVGQISHS